MMLKRLFYTGLFIVLFAQFSVAEAKQSYSGIVIDADTGHVLYAENMNQRKYPASLTKMMTVYLIFEALEQKQITMNTEWVVSKKAAKAPPSKLGLRTKQKIKVSEAINALIIKSANDVAVVAAENMSGSVAKFARKMNKKAKQLGMKKTYFVNPHGLPSSKQVTTAKDMALLGRALYAHYPNYFHLFNKRVFKFAGKKFYTHNRLVGKYGIDGLKTGFTNSAGYNLASSALRNGRRVIGIVMGGRTSKTRNRQMVKNIDRAYKALKKSKFVSKSPIVFAEKVVLPPQMRANEPEKVGIKIVQNDEDLLQRFWSIQIGAYRKPTEAENALEKISEQIEANDNNPREAIIVESQLGHIKLYRSRFTGFTRREHAENACEKLEGWKRGCVVIEPYQKVLRLVEKK